MKGTTFGKSQDCEPENKKIMGRTEQYLDDTTNDILNATQKSLKDENRVKYSELFQHFIVPLLSPGDTISITKAKIRFGIMAWNAALFKDNNDKLYRDTLNESGEVYNTIYEGKPADSLLEEMIDRKINKFSPYRNLIVDFELKWKVGNNYVIKVSTAPFDVEYEN